MMFVDFEIFHRMVSLQKLHFMTFTYFSKVKDSNRDLPAAVNTHSGVTNASTAVLKVAIQPDTSLHTAENVHSSMTMVSSDVIKGIFVTNQIGR